MEREGAFMCHFLQVQQNGSDVNIPAPLGHTVSGPLSVCVCVCVCVRESRTPRSTCCMATSSSSRLSAGSPAAMLSSACLRSRERSVPAKRPSRDKHWRYRETDSYSINPAEQRAQHPAQQVVPGFQCTPEHYSLQQNILKFTFFFFFLQKCVSISTIVV